jgi:hypothetical protein
MTIEPAPYVTISLAATITDLTEKAIRRKIEEGKWLEGWGISTLGRWRRFYQHQRVCILGGKVDCRPLARGGAVKRLWEKFGDWCEKYLRTNKEYQ